MARNTGVNFGGQYIVHPGAYSQINAKNMIANGAANSKRIVFLGSSESGEPGQINWFTTLSDAQAYLRSGDLLTAGELAWAPSGDGVGAGEIGFIRVSPALQAKDTKGSLTSTSIGYGATWNRISHKLEDGTTAGTKKYTLYFWPDNYTEVFDNIGGIFSIQYTGTQQQATLTITVDAQGDCTGLQTQTGSTGAMSTDLSYDFTSGQWATIQQVVADINTKGGYKATMLTTGDHNVSPTVLDAVTTGDIKTAPFTVLAMKGDFLYQTQYSQLATFAFSADTFPTDFAYASFTGGVDGTVPTDWTAQLQFLYGAGADIIVPLTSDASIHASCAAFVETQSNKERNEMIGFYGGALGETVDEVVSRAITLNSSRACVCAPGITRQATDGTNTVYAPYMTAALVAGRASGLDTGDSLTLNQFNLIGLEKSFQNSDIARMTEAGVIVLEFFKNRNNQGYRAVEGVTTYQADNNPVYRELSVRFLADDLNKDLREELETKYIGKKGTIASVSTLKNDVQSFLDQKVRDGWIVSYDPNSVQVTINNNVAYITYAAQPVNSIDYILITANYYNLPITA